MDNKMVKVTLSLWFNDRAKDGIKTAQRAKAKEEKNGFLGWILWGVRRFVF